MALTSENLNLDPLKSQKRFDEFSYFNMLKSLLPKGNIWRPYIGENPEDGNFFGNLLHVIAKEFNRLEIRTIDFLNESIPGLTTELIEEWEEFAGLPEKCFEGIFITDFSYDLILAFNSWSKGNGTIDKSTGNMPSWKGLYQNCSFENCTEGFGFINNSNDGYLNLDGVATYVQTNKNIAFTNASKITFEIKFDWIMGVLRWLCGALDDGNNYYAIYIGSDNKIVLQFNKAGIAKFAKSTDTVSVGNHTIEGVKDGATLKIYLDGVEVSYDQQDTYNLGDLSLTQDFGVGACAGFSNNEFLGKIYLAATINEALTEAQALIHHNYPNSMGLKGTNEIDKMILEKIWTLDERRAILHSKITQGKGDPSLIEINRSTAFFISYASRLGYTINVSFGGSPFLVDINRVGDRLWGSGSPHTIVISGDWDSTLQCIFESILMQAHIKIIWETT